MSFSEYEEKFKEFNRYALDDYRGEDALSKKFQKGFAY